MTQSTHPYDRSALLTLKNPRYVADLERFVLGAYESDTDGGDGRGDVSVEAIAKLRDKRALAEVVAKSSGIFCGELEARWVLEKMTAKDAEVTAEFLIHDGDSFSPSTPLLRLTGDVSVILAVERTLLNTIQRLSGIATLTHEFVKRVDEVAPETCRVAATRKTLCGLLDKRAVAVGGGLTHRLNLSDAPMFKSNHLKLLNSDWNKLAEVFERLPKDLPFVTVEVTDFDQARAVLSIFDSSMPWPLFLLFDNLTADELSVGIPSLPKPDRVYFESSGGITLENVRKYAKTGVDVVSIGALTHSVRAMDFSLRLAK